MTQIGKSIALTRLTGIAPETGIGEAGEAALQNHLAFVAGAGARFTVLDLEDDIGQSVYMIVYQDGSGWFMMIDDYNCPEVWALEQGLGHLEEAQVFPVNPALAALLPMDGVVHTRESIADQEALDAQLTALAEAYPDPPQALRVLLTGAPLDQPFTWGEESEGDRAIAILTDLALHLSPEASGIMVRSNREAATPATQFAHERHRTNFLREAGASFLYPEPIQEAMISGEAYAEFVDGSHNAAEECVLVAFSRTLLRKIARPTGWETEHNDGADRRISGYSTHEMADQFDLESRTAHAVLSSGLRLGRELNELGLVDHLRDLCSQHGVPMPAIRIPEKTRS